MNQIITRNQLAFLPVVKAELLFARNELRMSVLLALVLGVIGGLLMIGGVFAFLGDGAVSVAYGFSALGGILVLGQILFIRSAIVSAKKKKRVAYEPLSAEKLHEIVTVSLESLAKENGPHHFNAQAHRKAMDVRVNQLLQLLSAQTSPQKPSDDA